MLSHSIYTMLTLISFSDIISMSLCPKFQLIQPLDEKIGLLYAIITNGKYFIITNTSDESTRTLIEPTGHLPRGFEEPFGIIAYDSRHCSPPKYNLMAYKFEVDSDGYPYDWHIILDLINWNASRKWTKPARNLPQYLNKDGFINFYPLNFTFYWHKTKSIVIVQFPASGAPSHLFRRLYHTIKISNSCPPQFSYLEDSNLNITQVLKPYNNFDSCFVHNNSKILCVGNMTISSYDIDFNKTKDGELRVNPSNTVEKLPAIEKICNWFSYQSIWTVTKTTSTTTTEEPTSFVENFDEESNSVFWIIIFIIVVLIIITVISILIFWCIEKKRRKIQIESDSPGLRTASNASDISIRSNFDKDKMKAAKGITELNSTVSNISIRSRVYDNKRKDQFNHLSVYANQSRVGSQLSIRSEANHNNENSPMVLATDSGASPEVTTRSQLLSNNPQMLKSDYIKKLDKH